MLDTHWQRHPSAASRWQAERPRERLGIVFVVVIRHMEVGREREREREKWGDGSGVVKSIKKRKQKGQAA